MNIGVLSSGNGTNFKVLVKAKLPIQVLLTNKNCNALNIANNLNIQNKIYNNLLDDLKFYKIDFLVLAGYLCKIENDILNYFKYKVLNIHPSLLPKYGGKGMYGIKVHEAVIKHKEAKSGVTVHLVDEEYDKGRIIAQQFVQVYKDDTPKILQDRILKVEHKLYPKTILEYINVL